MVNEFWDFIGNGFIRSDHYLWPLCNEYLKWKSNETGSPVPTPVIRLASHAANFLHFKKDWNVPAVIESLRRKLRDKNHVKSILFEFRTGAHFGRFHKETIWLANLNNDSEPDLLVITETNAKVYIECMRKNEKPYRVINKDVFKRDILKGLRDKNAQHNVFKEPLLIALYVPEEYEWAHDKFTKELAQAIESKFVKNEYKSISGIAIAANDNPQLGTNKDGRPYYDTSIPVILFRNKYATVNLPDDLNCGV